MNFLKKCTLSMASAVVLFVVFGAACGVATFVESAYDTQTAWALVYGTRWFGFIQLWLGANLLYNIFAYGLLNAKKLPALIFHVGFLFILLGAGLTRYLGHEWQMRIREGSQTALMQTSQSFVKLQEFHSQTFAAKELYIATNGANDFAIALAVNENQIADARAAAKAKNAANSPHTSPHAKKNATADGANSNLTGSAAQNATDKNDNKSATDNANKNAQNATAKTTIATLTYKNIVRNAVEDWVESSDPKESVAVAEVFFSDANNSDTLTLAGNKSFEIADVSFAFNAQPHQERFIRIQQRGEKFDLITNQNVTMIDMQRQRTTTLEPNVPYELGGLQTFSWDGLNFSFKTLLANAKRGVKPAERAGEGRNALVFELAFDGKTREAFAFEGAQGQVFELGGHYFVVSWSPMFEELPFALKLRDFELQRYPGSNSPASYASEVTVIDAEKNTSFDYRIFMNHVLDYRGYRFFQSSYDSDEKGTILSVNADPGKLPTYFGYFLLGVGFLLNVMNPASRFRRLARLVAQDSRERLFGGGVGGAGGADGTGKNSGKNGGKTSPNSNLSNAAGKNANENADKNAATTDANAAATTSENANAAAAANATATTTAKSKKSKKSTKIAAFLGAFALTAATLFAATALVPATATAATHTASNGKTYTFGDIPPHHLQALSELVVQSADGRMKPLHSVATETLNKIHRSSDFEGLDAVSAMLFMMIDAEFWRKLPLVKVSDKELKRILGIPVTQKAASFDDFFDTAGEDWRYKLADFSEAANRKAPSARGTFDKEVIKADERLSVLYQALMGEYFRVVPKQNDPANSWLSASGLMMSGAGKEEIMGAFGLMQRYFSEAAAAFGSKNWQKADDALAAIKAYQHEYGAAVMPSAAKIKGEIYFNKLNIFDKLTAVYLVVGLVLVGCVFVRLFAPRFSLRWLFQAGYFVNVAAFVALTFGLGLRWYVAGHAPWSNAYESMIFIAWSLALSGIVFAHRSMISLALTALLAGVVLFVAHLSWMDPQITTLVPVLQSYWLTIHVSVITASYGFLGLCALLGFFTLVLFAAAPNNANARHGIMEATRINEMAMILGLSLLTMGNFLGGVWANESWGRYWGWDSKETWALVSILVYAAVVHFRFVRPLNSQYAFAVASMFAYWVIIMTYFGVNFYLTGMHSYASGDVGGVPGFVLVIVGVMVAVAVLALRGRRFSKSL